MTLKRLVSLTCLGFVLFASVSSTEARRRRHRRVHRAPAAAAPAAAAPAAGAKRKVALLSFSGPGGAAARSGVAQALGRHAAPLKLGAFEQTATQLGVNSEDAAGMATVCSKLKCDAVIKGSVQKKGARLTLTVTVFNGGTGEALGRRQAGVRSPKRLAAAGAAVGAQCLALVAKGKHQKGAPPPKPEPVARVEPPPKAEPEKVPEYKPDPEPETPSRRKSGEEGEGGEDEEGVSKRASGRTYAGLFDASFALGLAMRSAKVAIDGSAADPVRYDGGIYPEFTLRVDLFPLVLATKRFFKNFGLGISYGRHLKMSTKDQAGNPVSSASQELLIDLRYRWVFLKRDTSPEVTFFAGWGLRDFNLGTNDVMPSFNPKFIRFGFEGGVPFGTRYVGLGVGFDGRVVHSVGTDVSYNLGSRSGGFGFAARGGLQGRLALGIVYFVGVEFLRLGVGFGGLTAAGAQDIGKDKRDRAEPTTLTDQYVRFGVGAGFAY